jgi:DNA-binding MarR family transcriptional regulator
VAPAGRDAITAASERRLGARRTRTLLAATRELQRVGRTLHRLVDGEASLAAAPSGRTRPAEIGPAELRGLIAARRLRAERFGPDIGDVAWALLLEAYGAHLEGRRVAVTSLGSAEGIARSTAHRWTRTLLERGLLTSGVAPGDQRVTLVGLSEAGARQLRAYLKEALRHSPWPA